ncbi:hypothetical protein FA95DRAFT_584201 [Auriscalpium vulgare]|uniref:Uncharacterized protein n=1 Tax=Auriscalpium vulgare TaxID=40419 RepID=A0ACB8RFC5_9AGAM|nr:hypothetical protein FA95DRAFT_584201 [Auriscalpium vulgare]
MPASGLGCGMVAVGIVMWCTATWTAKTTPGRLPAGKSRNGARCSAAPMPRHPPWATKSGKGSSDGMNDGATLMDASNVTRSALGYVPEPGGSAFGAAVVRHGAGTEVWQKSASCSSSGGWARDVHGCIELDERTYDPYEHA